MSDASGTILKIIALIASPKAAVKFISIAVVLLLSWGYLNGFIESLGVTSEHKSIVMLFLALGIGSLVGELVNRLGEWVYKYTLGGYLQFKREKESELKKNELRKKTLEHFKVTYKHFSFDTKEILWRLSEEPQSIWDDGGSGNSIRALLNNGYVKQVSNVNDCEDLYELHPLISEYLKNNIEKEIDEIVDYFLDGNKDSLIKVMTSPDYIPNLTFREFFEIINKAFPVIIFNGDYDYDSNSFSNNIKGFEISPNKLFEKKISEKLQSNLFCRKFKVNGEEVTAT